MIVISRDRARRADFQGPDEVLALRIYSYPGITHHALCGECVDKGLRQ